MLEREFPCDPLSARVARRFVAAALAGFPPRTTDDAELLVSEVVTRIVVLGCTTLIVKIDPTPPVTIAVTYSPAEGADPDRVPGPVAPRLAARSQRFDIDDHTISHVFFLDAEPMPTAR